MYEPMKPPKEVPNTLLLTIDDRVRLSRDNSEKSGMIVEIEYADPERDYLGDIRWLPFPRCDDTAITFILANTVVEMAVEIDDLREANRLLMKVDDLTKPIESDSEHE